MYVGMRGHTRFTAGSTIAIVVAILFIVGVSFQFAPQIRNRVLEAIQLVAQHVELAATKSHVAGTRNGYSMTSVDGWLQKTARRMLFDILPLVGRMI